MTLSAEVTSITKRKQRKMKVRKPHSLTFCIFFITATAILTTFLTSLTPLQTLRPPYLDALANATAPPQPPVEQPPRHFPRAPLCTFVTPPSREWSYNSRSFCTFPRACVSRVLHLPSASPLCQHVTAAFLPHDSPSPCSSPHLDRITCAYSDGLIRDDPTCTAPFPLPHQNSTYTNAVFIPQYPFPANIYHFANVITTLMHILSHYRFHPSLTLVFLSKYNTNAWQQQFHTVLINHLRPSYSSLKVVHHRPTTTICADRVVLLGRRGHVNVWPFPNTTALTPFAKQIPTQSISFRTAFYSAYNIKHPLPSQTNPIVHTPPLILGYARRLGPSDPRAGNVHAIGTLRRFSDDDETWFQNMLYNQATNFGVDLRIFTTSADDSLREQVSNFASLGAVIGIHGANLVNCMFMPPLSVLIEVFPANVSSQCYYAGSNSGLRYIRFESNDPATPEESGCMSGRCMVLSRQRRVKIGRTIERERLTQAVRDGLTYLVELRQKYPHGVPVREDPRHAMYNLVE